MTIENNMESVKEKVQILSKMLEFYVLKDLQASDEKSTIEANNRGKEAYENAQLLVQMFTAAMYNEIKNLQSIGLAFEATDFLLAARQEK